MQLSKGFKLHLLAVVILFIASCNESAQPNESESDDTTSMINTSNNNKPAYDTSRSVTTISPNLYKTLADTLNIKMLQGIYKPGDSSIMHAHPDFAMYVLEGGTVELTMTDGAKQNIEFKKNTAVILPATSHSAKNIGKSTLRLVVVEVNRPRE